MPAPGHQHQALLPGALGDAAGLADAGNDWFHKYVVASVVEDDPDRRRTTCVTDVRLHGRRRLGTTTTTRSSPPTGGRGRVARLPERSPSPRAIRPTTRASRRPGPTTSTSAACTATAPRRAAPKSVSVTDSTASRCSTGSRWRASCASRSRTTARRSSTGAINDPWIENHGTAGHLSADQVENVRTVNRTRWPTAATARSGWTASSTTTATRRPSTTSATST